MKLTWLCLCISDIPKWLCFQASLSHNGSHHLQESSTCPKLCWAAGNGDVAPSEHASILCYHKEADFSNWTCVFLHEKRTAHAKFLHSCSRNMPDHMANEQEAFCPPPLPVLILQAIPIRENSNDKKFSQKDTTKTLGQNRFCSLSTEPAGSYFSKTVFLSWKGKVIQGKKPAFSHCLSTEDAHANV